MANSDRSASPSHAAEFPYDVAIIGMGSVGLRTALAYYASGLSVLGIDASADRLISVGAGLADLIESNRELLDQAMTDERFQLTADMGSLSEARSVIICVPTPVDQYFEPDVGALSAACATIVEHARPGQLLMLTSTRYVGYTEELLVRPLAERGLEVGRDVYVAFSAVRIESGSATVEQEAPPYFVGGATPACAERAVATLRAHPASVHEVPSLAIAEMAKLLENTFRAVDIALATELADTG